MQIINGEIRLPGPVHNLLHYVHLFISHLSFMRKITSEFYTSAVCTSTLMLTFLFDLVI